MLTLVVLVIADHKVKMMNFGMSALWTGKVIQIPTHLGQDYSGCNCALIQLTPLQTALVTINSPKIPLSAMDRTFLKNLNR